MENLITGTRRAAKTFILEDISNVAEIDMEIAHEIGILRNLDHPNIEKLIEVCRTENQYYLITELLAGGELLERISEQGCLTEYDAAQVMQQFLRALAYMHSTQHVAHLDLKPDNILLTDKDSLQIKLIDFGTAQVFRPGRFVEQTAGTPFYLSPEAARNMKATEKSDIWSCGVILYILLAGIPPFDGETDEEIIQAILNGKFNLSTEVFPLTSEEAKDLISKMLTYNNKHRPSAQQLLEHAFFQKKEKTKSQIVCPLVLENLRKFNLTNKIKGSVLLFLLNEKSCQKEFAEIENMFHLLDANNDGVLTKQEIINGFTNFGQNLGVQNSSVCNHLSEEELSSIFDRIDIDKSGQIEFSEFLAATVDQNKLCSEKNLKYAFDLFDQDKSGTITVSELKKILGGVKTYSEDVWNTIIAEIDQNKDGIIQWEEFKNAMMYHL